VKSVLQVQLLSHLKETSALIAMSLLLFVLSSCCHCPPEDARVRSSPNVVDHATPSSVSESLIELEDAANYLTVVVQSNVDAQMGRRKLSAKKRLGSAQPRAILACDPSAIQASQWLNRLKSKIDVQLESERTAYALLPPPRSIAKMDWVRTCASNCMCGVYADLIAQIPPEQLVPDDREFQQRLQKLQDGQTNANALSCAKALTNFCTSKLYDDLKSERD
jgi:hypothetical protein